MIKKSVTFLRDMSLGVQHHKGDVVETDEMLAHLPTEAEREQALADLINAKVITEGSITEKAVEMPATKKKTSSRRS